MTKRTAAKIAVGVKASTRLRPSKEASPPDDALHSIVESLPARISRKRRSARRKDRAAEALRVSEARCRSILNASPDNIAITDLEARIVMVSPAGLAMMGYEVSADLGHLAIGPGPAR